MQQLNKLFIIIFIGVALLVQGCSRISELPATATSTLLAGEQASTESSSTAFVQNTDIQATLSIYHSWPEEQRPALDNILREFSKRYPDIYFDITYIPPDELRELYSSQAAGGKGPSILLGPVEWGPSLAEGGLVLTLDSLIDASFLDNLNPAAVASSRPYGNLVSLPYAVHGVVLYRNQDLMTIHADNFEEMVILAQSASQGDVTGAYLEQSFFYSGAHLYGLGGRLMDENGYPAFATPEGEAWLRLLRAFQFPGKTAFLSDDDVDAFKSGQAGWIVEGSWKLAELAAAIGADRLMVDPWPEVENGRLSGFVQSENIYFNSNVASNTQEAATVFMQFFLGQEAQEQLVEVGLVPALLYMDMPRTEMSPLIAQLMAALARGDPYPVLPAIDLYPQYIDQAIQAYLVMGLPAGQALNQAAEAITNELNAAESTPTP